MTITFTVDTRPLSVNRMYRRARNGRMFISPEGVAYKAAVTRAATLAMRGRAPIDGPCEFRVTWYFDRAIGGTDIPLPDDDGPLKPTRDAMQGVVITDDKWIVESHTRKELDRSRPRAEVEVRAIKEGA